MDLNGVGPHDVPAYAIARANGNIPLVGPTPPTPLPGLSALQRIRRLAFTAAALFLAAVIATSFMKGVSGMNVIVPIVMVGGIAVIIMAAVTVRSRLYAELQHGYTTIRLQFGRARNDRWQQRTTGGGRLVWDYRGTWLLAPDGTVREAPVPGIDPPGFYPSPDRDAHELWTGLSWAGIFDRR